MGVRGAAVVLAAVVGWGAGFAPAAPPAFDSEAVDKDVEAARKAWGVPGVAVVIVKDGEVVHSKGYGHRTLSTKGAKDEPVTADTLFPLGSCTKAFTAAAIAALADDGKMDWDDPVRKHLPTFHLPDEAADHLLSLRDLLSHRSGIGTHDLLWYRATWDTDEIVRKVAKLPLTGPFRGGYQYSTPAVVVAGKAAENRFGGTWEELVASKLTTPLGMAKGVAFTTKQAAKFKDRAGGYAAGTTPAPAPAPLPEHEMAEANPAGSMHATPTAFGQWLLFHLNDGKVGTEQVISAKQLGECKQPHTPIRLEGLTKRQHPGTTQMDYAMGWVLTSYRGEVVVAHGGLIDGFRVLAVLLPERKAGFAIFANRHLTRLNPALGNALTDRLCGLPAKDWNAEYAKIEAADQADLKAAKAEREKTRAKETPPAEGLAGKFSHPAYGNAELVLGDKPEWRFSSFKVPLTHWGANIYQATDWPFEDALLDAKAGNEGWVRFAGIEFRRK